MTLETSRYLQEAEGQAELAVPPLHCKNGGCKVSADLLDGVSSRIGKG